MKKFLSVALAVAIAASSVSLAEAAPSKGKAKAKAPVVAVEKEKPKGLILGFLEDVWGSFGEGVGEKIRVPKDVRANARACSKQAARDAGVAVGGAILAGVLTVVTGGTLAPAVLGSGVLVTGIESARKCLKEKGMVPA